MIQKKLSGWTSGRSYGTPEPVGCRKQCCFAMVYSCLRCWNHLMACNRYYTKKLGGVEWEKKVFEMHWQKFQFNNFIVHIIFPCYLLDHPFFLISHNHFIFVFIFPWQLQQFLTQKSNFSKPYSLLLRKHGSPSQTLFFLPSDLFTSGSRVALCNFHKL